MIFSVLLQLLAPACALSATDWNAIINQSGGSVVYFGVGIGGVAPYSRNGANSFSLASTAKMITSGAALATLGKDYRFPTTLKWNMVDKKTAANLRVIGNGDPSTGMVDFGENLKMRMEQYAQGLKNKGVLEVAGDVELVAGDPRWDDVRVPDGWDEGDAEECYGALAHAFNMSLNCATVTMLSPEQFFWNEAEFASVPVYSSVRRDVETNLRLERVSRSSSEAGFVITGTWNPADRGILLAAPVKDPRPWVRSLFLEALKTKGIKLVPAARVRGDGEEMELTFYSPTLERILKPFMKNSLNMIGDALMKAAAAQAVPEGRDLLEAGQILLERYWQSLGLPPETKLFDGSGLSRLSKSSPRAMLAFLAKISAAPYFPAVWNSLPIAGVDGTLKSRMKGTAAAGYLRAKTGTLTGNYNLAGYAPKRSGGYAPFVMLAYTPAENRFAARDAMDRVGARFSTLHKSNFRETIEAYPFAPSALYSGPEAKQ